MSQPTSPRSGTGFFLIILLLASFSPIGPPGAHAQNLDPLFAPVTEQDIAAVHTDWSQRPIQPFAAAIDRSATLSGFRMDRISFDFEGFHQYGLLRYPLDYTPGQQYPVIMYLHGGFTGLWFNDPLHFDDDYPNNCVADSFFVVSPTFRGEALSGGELGNVISEGEPSFWNRDVDDSMAMLTAVLDLVDELDANRVVAIGQSRGGNVAYQMAVRDPRVQRTVVLFGPAQFRAESIRLELQAYVDGTGSITTALAEKVNLEIVQPWLNEDIDLASARHLLSIWSICDFLPAEVNLQTHHGLADESVSPEQSFIVSDHMDSFGDDSVNFHLYTYENGQHNPATLDGYEVLAEELFCSVGAVVSNAPVSFPSGLLCAWPNPFAGHLSIRVDDPAKTLPSGQLLQAEVFDLRGHRVGGFVLELGVNITWHARESLGRKLPAGQYNLRIRNQPQFPVQRIVLLN